MVSPPADETGVSGTTDGIDPGTGLYAGEHYLVVARQQVASARRSLQPVSIICFEVEADGGGSEPVATVATVLLRTLRESDASFRIGERRIAAVLEDTGEEGAVWAARRVRSALLATPGGSRCTVSAGIACYPEHALDAADLVARAEAALASTLATGRDRVEIATPG